MNGMWRIGVTLGSGNTLGPSHSGTLHFHLESPHPCHILTKSPMEGALEQALLLGPRQRRRRMTTKGTGKVAETRSSCTV